MSRPSTMFFDTPRLQVEVRWGRERRLEVHQISKAGQLSAPFEPPVSADGLGRLCEGIGRSVCRDFVLAGAADSGVSPAEVGRGLFEALFPGRLRHSYYQMLGVAGERRSRLVIDLRLSTDDPGLRWLGGLPWELMHDGGQGDFLLVGRRLSLVRTLAVARAVSPVAMTLPLRVATVAPQPRGLPALDLTGETERLRGALRDNPDVELTILDATRAQELREVLADGGFHVVHFMGHGYFDAATGTGSLSFEAADGGHHPVSGDELSKLFTDLDALALVFLNACESGRAGSGESDPPFAGVGPALLAAGVPAVAAMQFRISDRAAKAFSEAFYRRLVAEDPADVAVNEGRIAISIHGGGHEWATPVLLSSQLDGSLFEVRVPPAEREFRRGRDALAAGDRWAARETLTRALEVDDCHAGARALRCLLQLLDRTPGLLTLPEADGLSDELRSLVEVSDVQARELSRCLLTILHTDFYAARRLRPRGGPIVPPARAVRSLDPKVAGLLSSVRMSGAARRAVLVSTTKGSPS